MNSNHSTSVIKLTFTRFLCACRAVTTKRTSALKSNSEFTESGDYVPYQSETKLSDDINILRQLEAEIYTLTDQINTNSAQGGSAA